MSNYPDPVDSSTVLPGEDCPEMPELKPCPFCGSDEFDVCELQGDYWVECVECECRSSVCDDEEEAATAWNRRGV